MTIPVAIVEDEPWVRRLLVSAVDWKRLDLRVLVEADNGPQALSLCRQIRPKIVFTDIRIPGFDGLELIERLQRELTGTLYAIVSGHTDFQYAQRALRMGVTDYLLKPIRAEEVYAVLARMKTAIGRAEAARSVRNRTERENVALQAALRDTEWSSPPSAQSVDDPRIARALRILRERIAEPISVDDIAAAVGMSRSSFAEHFRRETGESFVVYLNGERIDLARSLLRRPEFSVAEVGRMAGYADPNYFIRVFRSQMAETPGDYRDRLLRGEPGPS